MWSQSDRRTHSLDGATGDPDRGGSAEDEVRSTLDERLSIELRALVGEEGILVASELASVAAEGARLNGQGDSLGALAVSVLNVEIVH